MTPRLTRGRALGWAHRLKGVAHHLREGYPQSEADAIIVGDVADEIVDWARSLAATTEVPAIVDEPVDDAADTQPIMGRARSLPRRPR